MRRTTLIASILTLLLGCDKPEAEPLTIGTPLTDLSGTPTILFEVFGPRESPRALPIAILAEGSLRPITLDGAGWRMLDSLVFSKDMQLSLYHHAADAGTGVVARGMWPADDEALYSLPGCRVEVPQAQLTVQASAPLEESVELLGSSIPLPQPAPKAPLPTNALAEGRTVADAVAAGAGITQEELAPLEFHARWLQTGAGPEGRTLLGSYVDAESGDAGPGAGHTSNIFVLAEDSAGTMLTSFRHTASGEARTVEFVRLINHADLDGDGVAELLLEYTRYAGVPNFVLLRYREGRWRETFRVTADWCVVKAQDGRR